MPNILASPVDNQTRCVHYRTPLDVVAIKFHCYQEYYPWHLCHEETAGHPAAQWPAAEYEPQAVLCEVCGHELSVRRYLYVDGSSRCAARFNPGCRLHVHLYFEPATSPCR